MSDRPSSRPLDPAPDNRPFEPPGAEPKPTRTPRIPKAEDFPDRGPNALGALNQRAWARFIDEVLITAPFLFVLYLFILPTLGSDMQPTARTDELSAQLRPWTVIGALAFGVLYQTAALAWKGTTIGKALLGLRVARYADGDNPTWGQAALRSLLPAAGGAVAIAVLGTSTFGLGVVLASAYFLPLRRGWQDLAGGTVVIRTR